MKLLRDMLLSEIAFLRSGVAIWLEEETEAAPEPAGAPAPESLWHGLPLLCRAG